MAIPSPLEWSLASISSEKRSNFLVSNQNSHEPYRNHANLSFLCYSSKAPVCSPVQDDASFTTTSGQLVELGLKIEDFSQVSGLRDAEDINGVICVLFEDPKTEALAYEHYQKAKEMPGFKPKDLTLNFVVRYLIHSKNWVLLYSLCDDFKTFQVLPDGSTSFRLISSCIRARKFKLAHTFLEIFCTDEKNACLAFDAAMKEYNKLHMYSSTITLYERMKSNGIELDSGCYCRIMEALMKVKKYDNVVMVFEEFERKEIMHGPFNQKIYWMLCESLGKTGKPFQALEYFREFTSNNGAEANHSFYSSLISSFVSIKEVKIAEELLEEAENKNMLRDPALFLNLVLMYIEDGFLEKSLDVIAKMKRSKIRASDCILCAIVNGFSRRRGLHSAVQVYEHLIMQSCEPGQVTYASILNIYCKLGMYSKAEMIFAEMEEKGFKKCVVAYSSMVAMYGKTGRVADATRLVAKMKERGCQPNVWIYNALLDMHGRALNLRQVEKVWKEMARRKISPDRVSYTSIISSYNRAKEYEPCIRYFHEFRLNGGAIDKAMAGIMVAVLSKMNRIDELVKLLQDMKAEGTKLDVRLYKSALDAFKDSGLHNQAKWLQESFAEAKPS
ncbi:OLC1v1032626C1 [Oldenlandia corymbosa var. corymbosa]|uniref:OLC1v1032626C1 n=1 Tax=Oldenlandia corymbosa var. corymbosa TaxID=529605 RepID=A0AAV1CL94_OLDCO|nr:OLC1v1032626C1 [Oldenlandia corymbosa var. corymbosa]